MKEGAFVLSLDFEGLWGAIGGHTEKQIDAFADRVRKNPVVVPRMLSLFEKYGIHCTWAIVGAMLCENKEIVLSLLTTDVEYPTWGISICDHISHIENRSGYFSPELIKQIKSSPNQEVGSHTFTHFYANETGVTVEMLRQEMELSRRVLDELGVVAKTIIMPRNQVEGLNYGVLKQTGFTVLRGRAGGQLKQIMMKKVLNFADAYIPLIKRSFKFSDIGSGEIQNVKASILFRPYFKMLGLLEPLKLWRIKLAMRRAAKNGECFHLWFHPHNVANNMDRNFITLESIFKYYRYLNKEYGFQSMTMSECAALVNTE